jgi:glycosyltransferase involved in cell wall biosynthesis
MRDKGTNVRLTFVIGLEIPFLGAASRRIEYFADFLSRHGFKVYIISPRIKYIKCLYSNEKHFKVNLKYNYNLIKVPIMFRFCNSAKLTTIMEILHSIIIAIIIFITTNDIVIISVPPPRYLLGMYLVASVRKIKLIVDVRDPLDNFYGHSNKFLFRSLINILRHLEYGILYKSHAITTVNELLAFDLQRAMPSLTHKIFVLPNGADLNIFKPVQNLQSQQITELKLFFAGRTAEGYNLPLILEAISRLVQKGISVKLYIAGTIEPWVFTYAKRLRILDNVIYLGLLSTDELISWMSQMDLAVLPYYNDPHYRYSLPAKFYEYIACGLPVLVSSPPYFIIAKTIQRNKIGIWCPTNNIDCIINSLSELYININKLMVLKQATLSYRSKVDRKNSANLLLKLILKILKL